MATSSPSAKGGLYRFGPYEADLSEVELRKSGVRLRLERKPWQILVFLIQRPGELVGRSELQHELWPDGTHVDFDLGLNVAMKKLRDALCDSAEDPKYVETVSGYGYRFVAKVERVPTAVEPIQPSTSTLSDSSSVESAPRANRGRPWKQNVFIAGTAIVCIALLAFIIVNRVSHKKDENATRAQKLMLVVLPFQNLSSDPTHEYLSDGITEELSAQLGNLNPQQLGVIGRTSAMTYKHANKTIHQIGQELGVRYILEGSVRREGNRLRVTAQLVQVSDQAHVWAQNYDRDMHGLLQIENEIASDIARQAGVSIAIRQPAKAFYSHSPPPEAHDDYLLARFYWNERTPAGWKTAEQYFRSAIQKDSQYGAAYAGLAECLIPPKEAVAAAKKAVELDSSSGEALTALGWVELYKRRDFEAAGDALKAAVQLDPNYAPAHHTYSALLGVVGRRDDAIREEQEAVALDPLFNIARVRLGAMLWFAGQDTQAMEQVRIVLSMAPQFPKAHESLGNMYLVRGMCKQAVHEFEISEQFGGPRQTGNLGYAYARCGDRKAALKILSDLELQERRLPSTGLFADLAVVEIGLGNHDAALAWLEKEYQQDDDDGLLTLKVDPAFDPLRSDPHFQEIVRKMNFPP